jgi:hypothetical protein
MYLSLDLCRAQEAHQRALASAAKLDNVRLIATAAAAAWAKEATAAEHREDRKRRTRAIAEGLADRPEPPTSDERGLSENPDRGHASVAGTAAPSPMIAVVTG